MVAAAKSQLCGRRLIRTKGPYGLALKTLSSGDKSVDEKKTGNVDILTGCVTPLVMIQAKFTLAVRDIAAFEQCRLPLDLSNAAQAAVECARQEDDVIFNGHTSSSLRGLLAIDKNQSIKLKSWDETGAAVEDMIQAVTILDKSGFHGPYALGLSPELYNQLYRRYPQGNGTELEHLRQIITDGIVKVPAISSGGVLLCTGDSLTAIVLGQDLMTGYIGPAGSQFEFSLSESIALWLTQPKSICLLKK